MSALLTEPEIKEPAEGLTNAHRRVVALGARETIAVRCKASNRQKRMLTVESDEDIIKSYSSIKKH